MRTRIAMAAILLLMLVLTLVAKGATTLYVVREHDNDAQVAWNDHEALLFIGTTQMGWVTNRFNIMQEYLHNWFGGVTSPDAKKPELLVVKYTSAGIVRYRFENEAMGRYTIFKGHVYRGGEWRWEDSRFVPTTPDEAREFWTAMRSYDPLAPHDGWRYRSGILHTRQPNATVEMQIDAKPLLLLVEKGPDNISIDIQVSNQAPQRVWSIGKDARYLTETEFDTLFSR